ncbi:MAG: radical SAM protein [Paracoccaceae bacterium]
MNFIFENPKVYLCQFSTDIKGKIAFYPYSAGCVWAYAEAQGTVKREQLGNIFFIKHPLEEMVLRFENPDIVGFSNYAWNGNYNLALSRLIKKKFPKCLILFGGPETPDNPLEWFEDNDHIDVLVHQEGERSFNSILAGIPLSEIDGITYRSNCSILTNKSSRLSALDDVPSPYLTGLFDHIDKEGRELNVIIETDRGCPFKCTFCDWGGVTFSKVKRFGLEKIFAEIEWAGKNKVEMIQSADANFGIFKERALQIAEHLVTTKKKYGFPKKFDTSWAKNSNDVVIEIASTLKNAQLGSRFDLSVQSLDKEVQKNIERDNLDINKFDELVGLARSKGLVATVELILTLPGETYESWIDGLCTLLDHDNIVMEVNPAQLLKNSSLSTPQSMEKFGIRSVDGDFGEWSSHFVKEYAKYIVATDSMPYEDLIKSWQWTWCARLGHVLGITNIIMEQMKKYCDVSARDFYSLWFEFITKSDGILNEKFREWTDKYLKKNEFVSYTYEFEYLEDLGNRKRANLLTELNNFLHKNFPSIPNEAIVDYFDHVYFNPNVSYPIIYKGLKIDHPGMGIFDQFYMFVGMTRRHGGWRCSVTNLAAEKQSHLMVSRAS